MNKISMVGSATFIGVFEQPFMRTFLYLVPLLLVLGSCKGTVDNNLFSKKISSDSLRDDFTYFRLILESVHPGLYQYEDEKAINRRFDSIAATLKNDASLISFYNKLSLFINSLHDGHTDCYLPFSLMDSIHRIPGYFPIPVNVFNGKLIVNSEGYDVPLGAELISINNEPVEELLHALRSYEPVDGYNYRYQEEEGGWDFSTNYFKFRGPVASFSIEYRGDSAVNAGKANITGTAYDKVMETSRFFELPEDVNYDMEIFDKEGYALLTICTFGFDTWSTDKAFENFIKNSFRLLQKTPAVKNLVIDLRNNTGGNFHDMFNLYGYLTNRPYWKEFKSAHTIFNKIPFTPFLNLTDNDVESIQATLDSQFTVQPQGRFIREYTRGEKLYSSPFGFKGRMFLIINSNVHSAAAYFASLLKDEGRATIVGDETGGSGSSTNSFHMLTYELPHTKIRLTVPIVHAEYSLEGQAMAGRGVVPDYPVSISRADMIQNRDTQLNFVLDSLLK